MQDQDTPAAVLVVDDEREVADLYAAVLDRRYAVQTAYGGREALDLLAFEPDVVLLDRRMPGLSGEEVLAEIRARAVDVPVAMVSGIEPDFDLTDVAFDEYLCKPVGPKDLLGVVERLLLRERIEEKRLELQSMKVTRNVLEVEKRDRELATSEEYAELLRRIDRLQEEIGQLETQRRRTTDAVAHRRVER